MKHNVIVGTVLLLCFAAVAQAGVRYRVKLTSNEGGGIVEVSDDEYVAGVLEGESSVFQSDEAMKAIAIAIRSYAANTRSRHGSDGYDFCSTTHCQRFNLHGVNAKLLSIVRATQGEVLWYEGKPAFAVYSRDCGGTMESATAIWPDVSAPYLMVKTDPYCRRNGGGQWVWRADPKQIRLALQEGELTCPNPLVSVRILSRTASNRAKTLKLEGSTGSQTISESTFRFAVGRSLGWNLFKSDQYEVQAAAGTVIFRGNGQGHGVGLCQDGADEMGREGSDYRSILAFYYPGTSISQRGSGLAWKRLGGNNITLYSTQPQHDGKLLVLAEQLRRQGEDRLQMTTGNPFEIYSYPDVETFRNATGEPGWVAAHTRGSRIDLQPVAVLERRGVFRETLRHELLHAIIETEATPGLPLWFREGLVGRITRAHELDSGNVTPAGDEAMRQRSNAGEARQGYDAAMGRVDALVTRYGEGTVLSWLKRGLPLEVRNASDNKAMTNSR